MHQVSTTVSDTLFAMGTLSAPFLSPEISRASRSEVRSTTGAEGPPGMVTWNTNWTSREESSWTGVDGGLTQRVT